MGTVAGVTAVDAVLGTLFPIALVATTVKVYEVPLVKPATVSGLAVPICEILPGFEITVYPVIAEPPLLVGAVNETVACVLPATAEILVGTLGTVAGVTAVEAALGALFPIALVATTVKV